MHYFEISLILFLLIGLSILALAILCHSISKQSQKLDEKIERNAMDLRLHNWGSDHKEGGS